MFIIFLILFVKISYSQSKHAALWNVDNYRINFINNKVENLESNFKKTFWYIDDNGELKLFYSDKVLYYPG